MKKEAMDAHNAKWTAGCACELRKTATQAVPGDGNLDAEAVFIGEAPGKNEDIEGRPFVGAAGKFLAEMLASIGMKRDDIYITNVVKYRPPNNRDPLPEEVDACREWLSGELAIINPKLVVLLGKHALNRFFPGEKISLVHGTILKKKIAGIGDHFYALYHPAAALYNGSMREVLMADFKKIPKVLEKITKEDT